MSWRIAFSLSWAELASDFLGGTTVRGLKAVRDFLLFLAISLMLSSFYFSEYSCLDLRVWVTQPDCHVLLDFSLEGMRPKKHLQAILLDPNIDNSWQSVAASLSQLDSLSIVRLLSLIHVNN